MPVPLVNFAKGEIAEELHARFDVQAYSAGVKRARNVKIRKYGGLEKRAGTRFVAEVFDATRPVRLMPFQFSFEQAYALELGHGYMRVAALGGMVLNEELAVTGLTAADPVQVTAAFHGYAAGDQVYFSGQAGDWSVLNGRFFAVLAAIDADRFTIDFDGTGFGAFTASTGGITRTSAPDPDPTPTPVPAPVDPPEEPDVGGGGGHCVTADTMILMADGMEKPAGAIRPGELVRTRHEATLEWGDYPVTRAEAVRRAVWRVQVEGRTIRASRGHPVWRDGAWAKVEEFGDPDGSATVVLLTVAGAHTYVSNGVLSHNKQAQ